MTDPIKAVRGEIEARTGERPYLMPWPYTKGHMRLRSAPRDMDGLPVQVERRGGVWFLHFTPPFFCGALKGLDGFMPGRGIIDHGAARTFALCAACRRADHMDDMDMKLLRRLLDIHHGEDPGLMLSQCLSPLIRQDAKGLREGWTGASVPVWARMILEWTGGPAPPGCLLLPIYCT